MNFGGFMSVQYLEHLFPGLVRNHDTDFPFRRIEADLLERYADRPQIVSHVIDRLGIGVGCYDCFGHCSSSCRPGVFPEALRAGPSELSAALRQVRDLCWTSIFKGRNPPDSTHDCHDYIAAARATVAVMPLSIGDRMNEVGHPGRRKPPNNH
jgi:hypothetical protein